MLRPRHREQHQPLAGEEVERRAQQPRDQRVQPAEDAVDAHDAGGR